MLSTRFTRFFQYLTLGTLRQVIASSNQQRLSGLAAEITYNAMLSLFPSILAVLTAISLFQPLQFTFQNLVQQIQAVAPEEVLWLIENFTRAVSTGQDRRLFSFSFIFALWTASGALSAAMSALDQIHQIPRNKLRPFWKARLVAIGIAIGSIILLLISLTLVFISDIAIQHLAQQSGTLRFSLLRLWHLLTLPLVLSIMSTLFAFIYRYGPSQWTKGQPIMPGAILAAIFWAFLSNLFRLYVRHFGNYNQIYGAVGAVIVLLLWLYMSVLVLLLGGQLNVTIGQRMRQRKLNPAIVQPK